MVLRIGRFFGLLLRIGNRINKRNPAPTPLPGINSKRQIKVEQVGKQRLNEVPLH